MIAIAIFGPTGVGKTSLALKIAKNYGEIISVDSRQVYKYMDIGTAKATKSDIETVPHHMINLITPDQSFTAGRFRREASAVIDNLKSKNKIPLLVGGTGLYFDALIEGLSDIPSVSTSIRESVIDRWLKNGQPAMYELLSLVDSVYAKKIHPNDKQRTLRALEIFYETKKPFSSFFISKKGYESDIKYIKIGINIDRETLYKRIDERVYKMVDMGLVSEVKMLLEMGYSERSPGLNTIGYKEIVSYLKDEISLDVAIKLIQKNSRHYAKRQLTWFRRTDNVTWFENSEDDNIVRFLLKSGVNFDSCFNS